jgi:hypothetical protein
MNRHSLLLSLSLGAYLTLGCDARGIRVGTQELCVADEALLAAEATSTEAVSTCARIGENQLQNDDFELPVCEIGFCQFPVSETGGWQSSSEAQVIELWSDGYHGVPAPEGQQFVELNATSRDTLWQELELPPNQLMYWSFLHRGRNALERVELFIGPPAALVSRGVFASPADAWYPYSGLYRVGANEPVTRFALASNSGLAEGNLMDLIVFAPVDD